MDSCNSHADTLVGVLDGVSPCEGLLQPRSSRMRALTHARKDVVGRSNVAERPGKSRTRMYMRVDIHEHEHTHTYRCS